MTMTSCVEQRQTVSTGTLRMRVFLYDTSHQVKMVETATQRTLLSQ